MGNSGSTSLNLAKAKGEKFLNQLLYVQHVDKEKDATCEIPEQCLHEYLISDCKEFSDLELTEYLKNVASILGILKSSLDDYIVLTTVYSNPLNLNFTGIGITDHVFVVFKTKSEMTCEETWWSLEKNGQYIVLQQSPNEDDVTYKLYDAEKKQHVQRLEPVEMLESARGNGKVLKYLLQAIWETSQIDTDYHFLTSNCQDFASFVFEKSNLHGEKWSKTLSDVVNLFRSRNTKTKSEITAGLRKYTSNFDDNKSVYYNAMIEGRRKDFEELASNVTSESLNSVDSQGYTLLEWATAFSTPDWPIDQFLKEKGAEIQTDEGLFRRNVFFIALKFLPPDKDGQTPSLAFDGIDIRGVLNKSGDTAWHLALNGAKRQTTKKILNLLSQLKDYDVNTTDSNGDTPLYLAIRLKREFDLIKQILARTNSESVNKHNKYGETALHVAILSESTTFVEELLKRKDVDVNVKTNDNHTALHFASSRKDFPKMDWFRDILNKSTDVNAQDKSGHTALHYAIRIKSKAAVKELLKRKDVDVGLKTNDNQTALHFACRWKNMPIDLFNIILDKSTDVNAQDKYGRTALHFASKKDVIIGAKEQKKNFTLLKELLNHKVVNVDVKTNDGKTALHYATSWENIPIDLFRIILDKSTNVNVQGKDGNTALHLAIIYQSKTVVEELLVRKDVDVNIKDNNNQTALHLACCWEDIPIDLFTIILEKSTDVNTKEIDGQTALHIAIHHQSKSALEELLKRKDLKFNLKNKNNQTALQFAAEWDNIPIDLFRVIQEKSTDVYAQDESGNTALQCAILNKSETEIHQELLKRKDEDVNLKNNASQTALHLACCWKDIPIDLFNIILEKSADVVNAQDKNGYTALHYAIVYESQNAIKELLKREDVNVNLKDNDKQTALYYASVWKDMPIDLFNIILERSADVNAQGNDGNTALHVAMFNESETALKELLNREDVDVDRKNNHDQTALHLACWKVIPIDLLKKILEKTSNVNAKDKLERTALHWAMMDKYETMVEELVKREDVNVNIKDNDNRTAFDLCSEWEDIPNHLFKIISDKATDAQAQNEAT